MPRREGVADPLEDLRRLGRPPTTQGNSTLDAIERRIDKATKIFRDVADLVLRGSTSFSHESFITHQLRDNWSSVVQPWLIFLLERFVLPTEEPETLAGIATRECVLTCFPPLLEVQDVNSMKPLTKYLVQTWFKIITLEHPNWGPWSALVFPIDLPETSSVPFLIPPTSYELDSRFGAILIRYLNGMIRRMPAKELSDFVAFISLIRSKWCFPSVNPLDMDDNRGPFLDTLISVLRALCKRNTTYRRSVASQFREEDNMYQVACITFRYISELEENIQSAQILVESRFIDVIFDHWTEVFLIAEEGEKESQAPVISPCIARTLDSISRVMPHQAVLRPFVRKMRHVKSLRCGEVEERMGSSSATRVVWEAWQRLTQKALILYPFYRAAKKTGLCCQSAQCPNITAEARESDPTDQQYFRCGGCLSVLYCSRTCQKLDWSSIHRKFCRTFANRTLVPLSVDTFHMKAWIQDCIWGNASSLMQNIQNHVRLYEARLEDLSNHSSSLADGLASDTQSIADKSRNPILFIDIDTSDVPSLSSFAVLDTPTILTKLVPKYGWESGVVDNLLAYWRDEVKQEEIMVVVLLPQGTGGPAAVWFKLSYPLCSQ
ncbi:hypothetical protein AAF712_002536 [Marasmius tenuissimus]|uniref:MYND-type domain-containing protein n=1 Tax=Marasmius tenuissimus TaxID=585030 RepID=A0ABR3A9G4_9AGAR